MQSDHQENLLFVKSLVDAQPAAKRVKLYRWLASVADDPWTTKQLLQLAADQEKVEQESQLFDLHFSHKRDGHSDRTKNS